MGRIIHDVGESLSTYLPLKGVCQAPPFLNLFSLSYVHHLILYWNLLTYEMHLSLFEFTNQNEERKFLPIQQGYALATGGRLGDPTYPWGYFNNIAPMMYPIMGSGRMRGDVWASNTLPSEGGLQLKGSVEVNYLSSLLFTKSKANVRY